MINYEKYQKIRFSIAKNNKKGPPCDTIWYYIYFFKSVVIIQEISEISMSQLFFKARSCQSALTHAKLKCLQWPIDMYWRTFDSTRNADLNASFETLWHANRLNCFKFLNRWLLKAAYKNSLFKIAVYDWNIGQAGRHEQVKESIPVDWSFLTAFKVDFFYILRWNNLFRTWDNGIIRVDKPTTF